MSDSVGLVRADELCGLLAEPDRLTAFAAVVLGAKAAGEVVERTGASPRQVQAALRRLIQGGLIDEEDGGLVARSGEFRDAVRESEAARPPEAPPDPDRARAAVLRAFVKDGRLVSIPAVRSKRRVILEQLATMFEPGVRYPEREVDALLRAWHDDYASLRRYLIDECLLAREAGVYWRTGGPVEV